ncbi:TIGR04086 family membrane protein [Phytoactinopolyspora alkaliphila]|uniref:TIGR04086 family membrane protein n=1 Tax=Phytoactinopolyspora alkaliphila TaxID=1783498 RepID=A0A6N9YLG9_9ACTN|nr:YrzE family protein [Phytoactinopolyspora alkaliphila]NED95834.1 TIGR04086 family membrane protein [Phytoactinopolyspora alkaliphila]
MAIREPLIGPSLVRWSAVLAGAVIGFALMILLSSLWVAWGEGGNVDAIADNLHWFAFATAVVALLVAGIIAGGLSGTPGAGTGLMHGVLVWGLILVVATAFSIPQSLRLFDTFTTPLPELGAGTLWATFLSLLIGLIAAGVGGLIGGGMASPTVAVTETAAIDEHRHGRHEAHSDERDHRPRGDDADPRHRGADARATETDARPREPDARLSDADADARHGEPGDTRPGRRR